MWLRIDGYPVHVNCRQPLSTDEQTALVEVIRTTRQTMAPAPYAALATELRRRLDALDLSLREAHRRWPQWNIGEWSAMLHGKDDPAPALAVVPS